MIKTATDAARRAIITFGLTALTTTIRRIIRGAITASVETHGAEKDLGVMADGARGTIIIMMMAIETTIEIAIETAIHTAIGVSEQGQGILPKPSPRDIQYKDTEC